MSYGVTLSEAEGVPVACKTVLDGAGTAARRLDHEAATLASIQHPCVIRRLHWDGTTLTTEFAGQPVRQIVTVSTPLVATIAATLAHTVADLHDAGLVHGSIEVSHVLVGNGGHPRLCSFGSAAIATVDLEAADVAGVGLVLRHLIGDVGDGDPIPEARGIFRRGRDRSRQYERRALLTIADQATADVPGHRPTARRLAHLIADTVASTTVDRPIPGPIHLPAHLAASVAEDAPPTDLPFPHPALTDLVVPDSPAELFAGPIDLDRADGNLTVSPDEASDQPNVPADPSPAEPAWPGDEADPSPSVPPSAEPDGTLRRVAAAAVGLLGLILVGAGVLGFVRGGGDRVATATASPTLGADASPEAEPPAPSPPSDPTTTTAAPPPPTTDPPVTTCGPAGAPDLDEDGCGDTLQVEGTVVRVGDVAFEVGRSGDRVTLGDWDCDGVVTPAVLRPATGEVFVFDEWTDSQLAVRPVDQVPAADQIYPDADAVGCDRLVVEDPRGRRTAIDLR